MWRMLQADQPRDYVLATGETHTVREFAQRAFQRAGLNWEEHVESDPRYLRPTEVDVLQGDASRAEAGLGWKARTRFSELVDLMVDADMEAERSGRGEFEVVERHFQ
jgi:GDPmannose 4,6-dehydratase